MRLFRAGVFCGKRAGSGGGSATIPRNRRPRQSQEPVGHLTDYPANIATGPALVQTLVAAGAAVDDLALNTARGETPLQWAVSANDVAVAAALLAAGAAVDGPQGDGRSLSQAPFYGQHTAAELLVQHGARLTLAFTAGLGRVDWLEQRFNARAGCCRRRGVTSRR